LLLDPATGRVQTLPARDDRQLSLDLAAQQAVLLVDGS
jgi:hypothetical protein